MHSRGYTHRARANFHERQKLPKWANETSLPHPFSFEVRIRSSRSAARPSSLNRYSLCPGVRDRKRPPGASVSAFASAKIDSRSRLSRRISVSGSGWSGSPVSHPAAGRCGAHAALMASCLSRAGRPPGRTHPQARCGRAEVPQGGAVHSERIGSVSLDVLSARGAAERSAGAFCSWSVPKRASCWYPLAGSEREGAGLVFGATGVDATNQPVGS
jgi:hypothetical protein